MRCLPIPGYPGYLVFEDGCIAGPRGRFIKPILQQTGYAQIGLCHRSIVTKTLWHRAVASAFLGLDLKDTKTQVNHKDSDKVNNAVANLELCNLEYNLLHRNKGVSDISILEPEGNDEKVCRNCLVSKPKILFSINRISPDGLGARCKSCMNDYQRNLRKNQNV